MTIQARTAQPGEVPSLLPALWHGTAFESTLLYLASVLRNVFWQTFGLFWFISLQIAAAISGDTPLY
jgi:hypothetical protein